MRGMEGWRSLRRQLCGREVELTDPRYRSWVPRISLGKGAVPLSLLSLGKSSGRCETIDLAEKSRIESKGLMGLFLDFFLIFHNFPSP